jgi:hypothetical protein
MRTIALAVLLLAVSFATVFAQNYRLEFYGDEALTSCELSYSSPGLVKVHMLVNGQGGPLSAIQFNANKPACMRNAAWIADVWEQTTVRGIYQNTQNPDRVDVILYCSSDTPPFRAHNLPVYLGWIWFSVTGPSDPCCVYQASAPALSPTPNLIMCNQQGIEYPVTTAPLVMNPNETCRCGLPLPTKASTWGSVKALYR